MYRVDTITRQSLVATMCAGIRQPRVPLSSGGTPSTSPARSIWRMQPGMNEAEELRGLLDGVEVFAVHAGS
jgi:hypothetical protein